MPCGEWLMRSIKYWVPVPGHCQQRPMLPMQVATYPAACSAIVAMTQQGAAVVSHAGISIMLGTSVLWPIISVAPAAFVIYIIQRGRASPELGQYLHSALNAGAAISRKQDASAYYVVTCTQYPVSAMS